MGAPTVIAKLAVSGSAPQLAARLWDVSPDARQLLVSRQVLRPRGGAEVFQLQPAGWHVDAGHALKLELLGSDAPHYRASNGSFTITISDLQLRLPVAERPGTSPIEAPAAPVMPAGARPAADLPPRALGTGARHRRHRARRVSPRISASARGRPRGTGR